MKRIVLIFFLLVATLATHAQVREFQIGAQGNSIVRSVGKDSVLVYTEVSPTEAYFLLYKDGDIMAQAFQLLPGEYVQVRDVRIHDGKTVYFCGTRGGGFLSIPYAVVGRFDIDDVFSGTGSVEWGIFQWVPYSSTLFVTDMTRLDLFEYQDTVRMAMVGKTVYDWEVPLQGTTVASAWFDGSNWQLNMELDNPDEKVNVAAVRIYGKPLVFNVKTDSMARGEEDKQ